jgi:hypothetical protein
MTREPFNLEDAWEGVAYLYDWIVSLFGAPAKLAALLLLRRKTRCDLLAWLGPVEALARRLLLLKALALPKSNAPPAPPPAKGRLTMAFADRAEWALDENPETWRVRFRVVPCNTLERPHPVGETDAPAGRRRSTLYNAYPLARRIEALRRVLDNPDPAVKRLAHFLATRRAALVAAFGPYRPPGGPARDALSNTQNALELALINSS